MQNIWKGKIQFNSEIWSSFIFLIICFCSVKNKVPSTKSLTNISCVFSSWFSSEKEIHYTGEQVFVTNSFRSVCLTSTFLSNLYFVHNFNAVIWCCLSYLHLYLNLYYMSIAVVVQRHSLLFMNDLTFLINANHHVLYTRRVPL